MRQKRSSRIFLEIHFEGRDQDLVREKGLEPPRIAAQDPKSCVSTNSPTLAFLKKDREFRGIGSLEGHEIKWFQTDPNPQCDQF